MKEFKYLKSKGIPRADALERAMAYAGVTQLQAIEDAKREGIRIANSALPPVGTISRKSSLKDKQVEDSDYEAMRAEMESVGVKLSRDEYDRGKKAGIY